MYVFLSSLPPPPKDLESREDHLISRIYYITSEGVERLQSEASSNGCRRSKLESFTAFQWNIVARGVMTIARDERWALWWIRDRTFSWASRLGRFTSTKASHSKESNILQT
ncbi:unnamed protein product [Ilex paraguariensis]|uniref:Uncharacterized protein n=1 Tax=Ilex paraguariensis TaxID=185542 RepID=A0ABC8TSI9_9AQUA